MKIKRINRRTPPPKPPVSERRDEPLSPQYFVQIPCVDEAEQRRLYDQFAREGRRVRLVTI